MGDEGVDVWMISGEKKGFALGFCLGDPECND